MPNDFNNLYTFSNYRLNCRERNLWRENEMIPLSPKLFETLKLLVENHGKTVSKDEMLQTIWADSFVEEGNLTQYIYTLRQIFGKDNKFIETVPRKGYRFIEPVSVEHDSDIKVLSKPAMLSELDPNLFIESDRPTIEPTNRSSVRKMFIALCILLICAGGFLTYYFFPFSSTSADVLSINSIELRSITDTGNSFSPAISSDGKFIVYVDHTTEGRELKLHDTSSGRSLDIEISGNIQPGFIKFSKDGRELFFRTRGRMRSGQRIYRVSYFGGDPQLVAENTWGKFDLSPDGKQITFFRADQKLNNDVLVIKDLLTGDEKNLVELTSPQLFFLPVAPVWSSDGTKIAYILRPLSGHRTDISVANIETGNVEKIASELSKIFQIAWHSDNKQLYAISKEVDKGRQLFSVEYPTGKTKRITNDFNDYEGLSVSADSRFLVSESRQFQSNLWVYRQDSDADDAIMQLTSGSYGHHSLAVLKFATEDRIIYDARNELERDLWQMSISTGTKLRLTNNDGSRNVDVTTTSDGNYLYLSSNRSGIDNLWKIKQDGSEAVQITFEKDEAHWMPVMSHDEKYIYYLARTASQNEIRKLNIDSMESKTIFVSKDFIAGHFIESSDDGRYLAFPISGDDSEIEISGGDDSLSAMKIGFLDLWNNYSLSEQIIRTSRSKMRFSNGGRSFDYIQGNKIVRQNINDQKSEPITIFTVENENIYNFDWSVSGLDLAIARGKQICNIVLISLK